MLTSLILPQSVSGILSCKTKFRESLQKLTYTKGLMLEIIYQNCPQNFAYIQTDCEAFRARMRHHVNPLNAG